MWLAAAYLLALGVAALLAPSLARRFLAAFARTPATNMLESIIRLLVGLAFVGAAGRLRWPDLAFGLGIFLAATALLMLALPSLHRRLARRSVAAIDRFLPLLGAASIILAILVALMLA